METYKLKNCHFRVSDADKYCTTIYPDGTQAPAIPMASQLEFAKELGYNNAWDMVKFHELIHTILCEEKGEPHSRVLWNIAHGKEEDDHWKEEEQVLLCQRVINRLIELGFLSQQNG